MNTTLLKIKSMNVELDDLYKNHSTFHDGDCGIDLFIPEDITIKMGETKFIDLNIKCEMIEKMWTTGYSKNIGYQLYPRSSISKTPLILANSVGIIDAGYRGSIIAAVKYVPTIQDFYSIVDGAAPDQAGRIPDDNIPSYTIKKHQRLFQICKFTGESFKSELVESLSDSERQENSFGSTGL